MSDAKKLSSMDASFLYLETPEMPMHVGSMAIFRRPDGYEGDFFEDFKAMIASRLQIAPILKARLEKAPLDIDHPSWVEDDQFDIDRHIFRGSLPAPHDRATLERIVGWMHAKLLNRARPLWEFYVFERGLFQPRLEDRRDMQPRGDHRLEVLEEVALVVIGQAQDRHASDVHRHFRCFQVQ